MEWLNGTMAGGMGEAMAERDHGARHGRSNG